jgi:hypothetical protein
MPNPFEASTLHILHNGHTLGTGFLVAKDLAVTCAHIVAATGETIQVQFADRNEILSARVIPEYFRDPNNGDIAFLRPGSIPENITLLRLGAAEHSPSGNPFQAFGYPSVGKVEGVHARGEVLGMVAENGQRLLQLRSVELNQGHSGAPVWDEKRGVVVGMVVSVYKSDASGKLRDTAFAVPSETLWQVCPEIRPSETAPYLGLETFTDETAQFFFGREALTEKLLNVLRGGCRYLAVLGPSGSGKSSVVRAGLLPALKKGQLSGSQKWAQITMRPADNPFEQMEAAGLDPIDINGYLKSHADAERVVLFVDQVEELFTLCLDDIRNHFIRDLATALENSKLILILSMRDDFYSAFNAKATLLAESKHLKIENVPGNLKRDELLAMIERPADAGGLAIEEGLTELILKDLTTDGEARSSTLPLLEFALTQLWEKRRDGLLTHEAYQSIGGVTGSLARWADDAYSDLPKADQALAESVLTSLVHLVDESQGLPDTRRRRTLMELGNSDSTRRVIKHFTDRRLIVTSGETVELVHDALLSEWRRLHGWIKDDRANLRLREGVSDAARQWESGGRDESLLIHRGSRLELAVAMSQTLHYPLNEIERSYLDACTELREHEKITASQVALATEYARLFKATEVVTSSDISDLDEILSATCQVAMDYFRVDHVGVVLFDEDLKTGKVVAEYPQMGIDGLVIPLIGVPTEEKLISLKEAVAVKDVQLDPGFQPVADILTKLDICSILIVPIISKDRIIGSFGLDVMKHKREFTNEEIALCKIFAAQISGVIENAQRYQETKTSLGGRTALAWTGMVSSVWRHAIMENAITIRDHVQLLRLDLAKPEPLEAVFRRLDNIERVANRMLETPTLPPQEFDEGLRSISVNGILLERTKQLWEREPYRDVLLDLRLDLDDNAKITIATEWFRRGLDILIDNAVDATSGQDKRIVTISTRQGKNGGAIEIADNGRGISTEILSKLFREPIKKTKEERGLGMGLLLARTILQTYNADLKVGSTGPNGTVMVISFNLGA